MFHLSRHLRNLWKMKIFISTLLLIIAICLHFDELNAASRERSPIPPTPTPVHGSPAGPDREIRHGDLLIKLWLDRQDPTRFVRVDYQDTSPADPYSITVNNFLVKIIDVGGFKLVGYEFEDERLFAVRAPNPNARPNDLEPNPSTFFVVYAGKAYKVKIDCATQCMESFGAVPGNVHESSENQRNIQLGKNIMGTVSCIIFRRPNGTWGAELDPGYRLGSHPGYRLGSRPGHHHP